MGVRGRGAVGTRGIKLRGWSWVAGAGHSAVAEWQDLGLWVLCAVQTSAAKTMFLKILGFYERNMKLDFCPCLCVMHATPPGERHHAFTDIILLSDVPKAYRLWSAT